MLAQSQLPSSSSLAPRHRRQSSLSTTCSLSSTQTRVLPFASAKSLRPLSSQKLGAITEAGPATERGFALAQPRRVITQPATSLYRHAQRRSVGIGALLSSERPLGKTRGQQRPIIGLGLTLNPRDTLVKLQPRRSAPQLTADETESGPLGPPLHPEGSKSVYPDGSKSVYPDGSKSVYPDGSRSVRSSVVLSEAFSGANSPLLSPEDQCTSPLNTDLQLVTRAGATGEMRASSLIRHQAAALESWQQSPSTCSSSPPASSCTSSALQTPSSRCDSRVPSMAGCSQQTEARPLQTVLACLLCFERVKIQGTAPPQCPGCGTLLSLGDRGCALYRLY